MVGSIAGVLGAFGGGGGFTFGEGLMVTWVVMSLLVVVGGGLFALGKGIRWSIRKLA